MGGWVGIGGVIPVKKKEKGEKKSGEGREVVEAVWGGKEGGGGEKQEGDGLHVALVLVVFLLFFFFFFATPSFFMRNMTSLLFRRGCGEGCGIRLLHMELKIHRVHLGFDPSKQPTRGVFLFLNP